MIRSKPVNGVIKASVAIMFLGIGCGPPGETQLSPPGPVRLTCL